MSRFFGGSSKPTAAAAPTEIDTQYNKLLATAVTPDDPDALSPPHLVTLAGLIGVHEDDIVLYIIAWKLGAKKPCKIQREEWSAGMRHMNIASLDKLKLAIPALRNEITSAASFRSFYMFVFEWLRETSAARCITNEAACVMWPLLFRGRKLALLDHWLVFITDVYKKSITKDLWSQTPDFLASAIEVYDPSGSWPSAMDDFVEWMKKRKVVNGLA